ncbi:MAG: hypothetical protein N2C14_02275, partial [Planctomycetales bacterium]
DGQSSVVVNIVEGGDQSGNDATTIGKCVVRGLPVGLPAGTSVDVVFHYGHDGRLTVKAELPSLKREALLEVERASGMTPRRLEEWNEKLRDAAE